MAAAGELSRQWPGLLVATRQSGRSYGYRQGFGIGGGSSINSLILAPGDTGDYDRWADDYRCDGWTAADVGPWLDLAAKTPSRSCEPGPVTNAFVTAAAAAGHPVGGNTLMPDRFGVLETRLLLAGDRRHSSYDQYIAPILDTITADRFRLVTGRTVSKILSADRSSAPGLQLSDGSTIRAKRVVVSCGAVQTPKLLRASGLGRPSMGERFQDHPSFAFTLKLRNSSPLAGRDSLVSRLLRWSSGLPGALDGDLQAFVIDRVDSGVGADDQLAVLVVGLMDVTSVGSVPATDSGDQPSIITGALSTKEDRDRMRKGVKDVDRLLTSPSMSEVIDEVFIDELGTPVSKLRNMTDHQLDRWILEHPGPYAHPVASCPMGPADDMTSIVSHDPAAAGKVHGDDGIHVIDASVMPRLVRSGLQLPVTALAERLAAALRSAS